MNKKNILGIVAAIVIICIVISAFIIVNNNKKEQIKESEIEITTETEDESKEEKIGIIGILTVDAKTGEGIEGVKYKIYDADMDEVLIYDSQKNKVDHLTSNAKGQAAVKNLKLGKYFYKQVEVPEQYTVDESVYEVNLTKEEPKAIKKVEK